MNSDDILKELDDSSEITGARKFLITINNPDKWGFSRDGIIELCTKKKWDYCALSFEIGGKEGTPHFHLFIYHKNTIKFDTIKKCFPKMHYDVCNGRAQEVRAYVFKEGVWAESEKGLTSHPESFWESGDCPIERQGRRLDMERLYNAINDGLSTYEIIQKWPEAMKHTELIDRTRTLLHSEKFSKCYRDVTVCYVWGEAGTGKTKTLYDTYGYDQIHRVSDYDHPFDSYSGQDVLVLDEYRSDFKLKTFLNLTDGYPMELSARYFDRWACFTKIYIVSNVPLSEQYKRIQMEEPESWKAVLRRIKSVTRFTKDDIVTIPMEQWRKNPGSYDEGVYSDPFDKKEN